MLSNTNFISSRHIKKEKALLPVDVRRSKTPLLKLPVLGTHICLTPSCDFVIYKLFLKFHCGKGGRGGGGRWVPITHHADVSFKLARIT